MRFVKPDAAPVKEDGGGISSWRRQWIENKTRAVLLDCGHIEDLNDRTLTFINSFEGSQIDCVKCGKFVNVKKPLKRVTPAPKLPDQPLF